MKKLLSMGLVVMLVILTFAGCGNGQTYDGVLKEYTAKIEEATPTLIEEFKTETSGITDVTKLAEISNAKIQKLAEISNAKIQKLAEISTEGIGKMAEIKLKNNDDNSVYEEWAQKLTDVYEREAKKITDEYETVSSNTINSLLP